MAIGRHAAGILVVVVLSMASMDTSLGPLCDPFPGAMGWWQNSCSRLIRLFKVDTLFKVDFFDFL